MSCTKIKSTPQNRVSRSGACITRLPGPPPVWWKVSQAARRIDRVYQAPQLVVFKTRRSLKRLDVSGDFATCMGASMAIHSGSWVRAPVWARDLYEAFGDAEGIRYASSMQGGAAAFALNECAVREPLFPPHPEFHRALADNVLLDPLKHAAQTLGYALR